MGLFTTGDGRDRVYVSISQTANRQTVKRVMKYLQTLDTTLYTYDSSTIYSKEDLSKAEVLIVIPPSTEGLAHKKGLSYAVGRGNFEEAKYFCEKVNSSECYIVSSVIDGLYLDEISYFEKNKDCADWNEWGNIITYGQEIPIVNYTIGHMNGPNPYKEYYKLREMFEEANNEPQPCEPRAPEEVIARMKHHGMMPIDTSLAYGNQVHERVYNQISPKVKANFAKFGAEMEHYLFWGDQTRTKLLLIRSSRRLK